MTLKEQFAIRKKILLGQNKRKKITKNKRKTKQMNYKGLPASLQDLVHRLYTNFSSFISWACSWILSLVLWILFFSLLYEEFAPFLKTALMPIWQSLSTF